MASLLLWVLIPPLLGFIILGLLGRTLPRSAILTVAWGTVALSFLFALSAFLGLLGIHPDSQRVSDATVYTWTIAGDLQVHFGLLLDPLSATMLLVITGVGLLIHIYSAGYMADDPGFWRFFSYLNFFIFAMTLLVSADNLLFLLVGWGLVGLASFLLIGFWYQRPAAVAAARKALVINVIGDFGLMLAIFLLFKHFNTVDYGYGGPNCIPGTSGYGVLTAASCQSLGALVSLAIPLLLFVACAAKSAQLPLYMWLPDAMEGPTPVSALIHAATMVTAGVYLVARAHALFTLSPYALPIVGAIGGLTALFAATIALTQLDIKRVLAYSTISQLGYMFMGESAGSYSAGIFHLTTHAYFKALLFLGAGAVIHALGGEQDMREMGGLRYRMPITFWTFLIAVLAISGIPPFAGFWSKDDILSALLTQAASSGGSMRYLYYGLWGLGILTAGLTALYMFRLFYAVFMGNYRGTGPLRHGHGAVDEEEGEEEEEAVRVAARRRRPESALYEIYEAPAVMTVPLVILAILSTIGGLVGSFALFNYSRWQPLNTFLEPVLGSAPEGNVRLLWLSTGASLVFALLGLLIAWRRYGQGFVYKESRNPLYRLVYNKYYVDEVGIALLINPLLWLGRQATVLLEGGLLDGGSRLIARAFGLVSAGVRRLQTGYVRNYALAILVGVILILLYYVVRG
uniref:NADH-quinone oxidoreductase subunit L n=1 Tax=Thermogemmatispora argillosa TaxID=2045280 RepID=A0A455T0H6_9CHLR|nr:NADH-quinone oxidoreductase subunit L [Thermogemmatispora argillosa]